MLRQEELAFLKALSCAQPSPALLKELRKAVASARKKMRPTVPTGSRNTTFGGASIAPHRSSTKVAGKRKANELAGSGDSSEPATRRPAPGDESAPLPATSIRATGEQAASGGRQIGSSEGGATYAAVVATPVAPHKPSGPLKPTAKGSDPSEPAVSSETAPRRMSTDMSGPLSCMPVGTTVDAHVANPCLPAGECPNKTPIFITIVGDTRVFLVCLRSTCPCDLTAQLKAKKLMVVPSTADGFRATVCALRSLDGGKGVSFHTFSLPEDRCVRLLVKNLGKGMPDSAVREELESLNFRDQGVMQLRSARRNQDTAKDRPPTPQFIVSVARGPEVTTVRSLTELCGLRVTVETYVAPKGPLQCKRCQRFGHTQRNCGNAPRCVACGGSHLSGDCPAPQGQPRCCSCEGKHTANYRGCVRWKEAKAALAKRTPEQGRRMIAQSKPAAAPKANRAEPFAEQMDLGEGWSHVVRGGRIAKASAPKPIPQPVTEAPTQPQVTVTKKAAKPEKAETKTTTAPNAAGGKPKKPATTSPKPVAANQVVANPHPTTSPIEGISDLLDNLPLDSCVELIRRLLTSIPSLPKGAARPRAILKTVILFMAEYGSTP